MMLEPYFSNEVRRYGVPRDMMRPLIVPFWQRREDEIPLKIRPTLQGDRLYTGGTNLTREILTADTVRQTIQSAIRLSDERILLPRIRYWTAALACAAWFAGADASSYPRKGYRKGQTGYWYGQEDVIRVRADAQRLSGSPNERRRVARLLRALCGAYAVLAGQRRGRPLFICSCEAQIEWSLSHFGDFR
ncbi:MAG: hypothetical protein AAFV53_38985 [Myxococcota bacterium]